MTLKTKYEHFSAVLSTILYVLEEFEIFAAGRKIINCYIGTFHFHFAQFDIKI
jgi:hypothetical protein